jgi:hypothetical protein
MLRDIVCLCLGFFVDLDEADFGAEEGVVEVFEEFGG